MAWSSRNLSISDKHKAVMVCSCYHELSMPAIAINNLSVRIGNFKILEDIDIDLPSGEVIGLLGPSGAGKTTLMRTIVGRQRVTSGTVTVLGLPAGSGKLRSEIGYVTQAPSVYADLTVIENLQYFAAMIGVPRARAREVLEAVRLAPQARQITSTLSGGERSRASLAVALLGRPKLLVLDEPTVGVDPVLRRDFWAQFQTLATEGATLLVSSHVMDEAEHCDHLLLLREGKLLAYGTVAELAQRSGTSNVEQIFLKLVEAEQ